MDEVARVAASEEVDLVHLLYGDCLYRHFGALLDKVPCRKMATFHQFRHSALRDLSVKRIHKVLDLSVVHTDSLARFARSCGGCEVAVVQYPVFESLSGVPDPDEAKRAWGLKPGVPVVAALGGTRTDKVGYPVGSTSGHRGRLPASRCRGGAVDRARIDRGGDKPSRLPCFCELTVFE